MKYKALILGSGGAHGEFQVGVLPTLARYYDSFDMYVGVGVGSLHSSVLAQHDDFITGVQVLMRIWQNMTKNSDILNPKPFGTMGALISEAEWASDGAFGNQKLKETIEKHIQWERLKNKNNWAIKTTSLTDGLAYTITNNKDLLKSANQEKGKIKLSLHPSSNHFIGDKILKFILAAGMVPMILPPVDIFNHRFVEGGIRDVAPLQTAIDAFEIAKANDGYTEAEFVIINNYVSELDHEPAQFLDSGSEILLRSIKIMTIEMAKNDLILGTKRLEDMAGIQSKVITLQPQTDTRLHPMNFGDMENRLLLRAHGQDVAQKQYKDEEVRIFNEIEAIQETFMANPENQQALDQLYEKIKTHPEIYKSVAHKKKKKKKEDWAIRFNPLDQTKIQKPQHVTHLKNLIKDIGTLDKKTKAMGSGYAFSNILDTKGIQISLDQLKKITKPKADWIKPAEQSEYLYEIEAGCNIQDLNDHLWQDGKTLLNQPGYEHLNFFGVCTTGGHGSGSQIGPISEAILSMHLITLNGQGKVVEYKIEPTDGITNAAKFQAANTGISLIQDDQTFNAVLVSAGCMGIVYSLIIKTQDSFFLEESRTCEVWEELKPNIIAKLNDPNIHSIHLWFNPYKINGKTDCVLSEYRVHQGPEKGKRPLGMSWNIVDDLAPLLIGLMKSNTKKIPNILSFSLRQTVNRKPVVMKNPLALNFGSPNHTPVFATNFSVPTSKLFDYVDGMQKLCADRAQQNVYVTGPIGLRFTSPGTGYISPQYDQASCMVEVPLLQGTDKAMETIAKFHEMAFKKFAGRPHWGQLNPVMTKSMFKKMFPEWKLFIKAYDKFNKGHFDNAFTKQLKLRSMIGEV